MQVFRSEAEARACYEVLRDLHALWGIDLTLPGYLKERTVLVAGEFLKKRVPAADAVRAKALKVEAGDLKAYPALVDFLSAEEWPDGTERKPGTMLLFVDQGKAKVCLSDRDQGLVLFLTVDSLALILEACDDVLKSDEADWRPAKGGTQTRRSK